MIKLPLQPLVVDYALIHEQIISMFRREYLYITPSLTILPKRQVSHLHICNRHNIVQWFYNVVGRFDYDREIVPISLDYLDRFLLEQDPGKVITVQDYQLMVTTSLYLAIKLYTGNVLPEGDILIKICAGLSKGNNASFSPQDIYQMEARILTTLKWRVNPSSPMIFIRYFSSLMASVWKDKKMLLGETVIDVLREMALYLAELAVRLPETTTYFCLNNREDNSMDETVMVTPSLIAYSCLLLSFDYIPHSILPLDIRELFLLKCKQLSSSQEHLEHMHPDRNDVKDLIVRIRKSFLRSEKRRDQYNNISEAYPIAATVRQKILLANSISSSHATENSNSKQAMLVHYLYNNKDAKDGVVKNAMREVKVGRQLKEVKEIWANINLGFTRHKYTSMFIPTPSKEVVKYIKRHQMELQEIHEKEVCCIGNIKEQVVRLQKFLKIIEKTLQRWTIVSILWLSLESSFLNSVDIQSTLPHDTERFKSIDTELKELSRKSVAEPNCVRVCCANGRYNALKSMHERLELCQNSLDEYLNTKKKAMSSSYCVPSVALLNTVPADAERTSNLPQKETCLSTDVSSSTPESARSRIGFYEKMVSENSTLAVEENPLRTTGEAYEYHENAKKRLYDCSRSDSLHKKCWTSINYTTPLPVQSRGKRKRKRIPIITLDPPNTMQYIFT